VSRDRSVGIAMGYRLDGRVSNPSRGKQFFSSSHYPDRPTHSLLYNGCEADHSPLSSAEVENVGAIPPVSLHGVVLN
jgi:hypothetical protein